MIDDLYKLVEKKYFESNDFNGFPIYALSDSYAIHNDEFKSSIRKAIDDEILTATFHGNTHIKAFSGVSKNKLLEWLSEAEYPSSICLYPHPNKLKSSKYLSKYENIPYSLELAKGSGQLDYRSFDISVLEYYRNDPRYLYNTDYIHGYISISDEYYQNNLTPEHDQILLQSFGFSYDDDLHRYVAVFLRYLSNLSPEHQLIWKTKEINGNIKLHPDYYASSIEGSWGTRISIFSAFTEELKIINKMCELMNKPHIFNNNYNSNTPKQFGFLLRPTTAQLEQFVLLLDKMMSDNINKKFFKGDIDLEN